MYYIYQHISINNEVFFIGRGTISNSHSYKGYNRAYSKTNRNKEWNVIANNGFSVQIVETSQDINYILNKLEILINECSSCVNKQPIKSFTEYSIIKLSETLAEFKILNRTWYISSDGRYFNLEMKELTLADNGKGYLTCKFQDDYIKKNVYIHKLVGQAFVDNPNNYKVLNHLDRNKYNNTSENLEWCTHQENCIHNIKNGGHTPKPCRHILQYDLKGNFIKEWSGVNIARDFYKCSHSLIYLALNNKTKTALNYVWKYK